MQQNLTKIIKDIIRTTCLIGVLATPTFAQDYTIKNYLRDFAKGFTEEAQHKEMGDGYIEYTASGNFYSYENEGGTGIITLYDKEPIGKFGDEDRLEVQGYMSSIGRITLYEKGLDGINGKGEVFNLGPYKHHNNGKEGFLLNSKLATILHEFSPDRK